MSVLKNIDDITIFYTDTDSFFINLSPSELNKVMNGIVDNKELGKLKLEYVIEKAAFLAPKCYYLVLENGEEIIKIKGVKKDAILKAKELGILNFESFKKLLNKDGRMVLSQEKWFKSYLEGKISILDSVYEIKQTDNKRDLIYENDICVGSNGKYL